MGVEAKALIFKEDVPVDGVSSIILQIGVSCLPLVISKHADGLSSSGQTLKISAHTPMQWRRMECEALMTQTKILRNVQRQHP